MLFALGTVGAGTYLGDDVAAGANCHIMRNIFKDWAKSSYSALASSNDRHAPSSVAPKYASKA